MASVGAMKGIFVSAGAAEEGAREVMGGMLTSSRELTVTDHLEVMHVSIHTAASPNARCSCKEHMTHCT